MSPDYQIGMLWISGRLSYLEQLCVKSFVDAGHHVKLYTYEPVEGIPEGVETADASEILPLKGFLTHERTGSPALHSDLFRYEMLKKNDRMIWADTDAYCVKAFQTDTGHFYGWESSKHINGGVLGLPQDCDTLNALLAYTTDEFAIPDWYGPDYKRELEEARDAGNPVHAGEQPWGVWGPHAVTHFLQKTGEARYALPQEGLYPFTFKQRRMMLKPNLDVSPYVTDNTYSIHFYGRRMRKRLVEREGGEPHPDSLLGRLLKLHDIVPSDSPLPPAVAPIEVPKEVTPVTTNPAPVPASEKAGRGQLNLTDLADKYGSDKGSTKHRYTELYNMLFQPFRHREITMLEMGLQIGGPEHGKDATRQTTDAPSIRMWLEYFTKAQVIGLDVSDFSWFKEDRFDFIQCDMDKRENIAAVAKDAPEFDIIIDDASHASHHQQYAFLELFPKLKSGGLYIIEDLRWQPDAMETKGYPKTADMFQSYLRRGVFEHPTLADELNGQRLDISGAFVFQAHFIKRKKDQVVVIHKR